jgi:hypothetical protein
MNHLKSVAFGMLSAIILSTPAAAVQHVVTLAGVVGGEGADQRYEFAGDLLQSHYGLTTSVGGGNFGPSYLPPLERAVAEVRTPQPGGRTRGFHAPTAVTGIPVADGGTGVTQALTNVGALAPSNITTAWVSNQAVAFTLVRSGTTLTYTMGNDVWTHTAASVAEINAIQFRLRSAANSTTGVNNGIRLSGVTLTQGSTVTTLGCSGVGLCGTGLSGAFTADAGDVHISLFDGINGDFSLAGNWAFDLTGGRLNGNNAQIKLLSVPTLTGAIPEPASWAMLIAGFGLIGASLRRRRAAPA